MTIRKQEVPLDSLPPSARLVSMKGLTAALCMSRPSIYNLIANGALRMVRIGSRQYATLADLNACIANLRTMKDSDARGLLQPPAPPATKKRRRAA